MSELMIAFGLLQPRMSELLMELGLLQPRRSESLMELGLLQLKILSQINTISVVHTQCELHNFDCNTGNVYKKIITGKMRVANFVS